MRKFRVFSDLHMEGRKYKIEKLPIDSETTLILAGDIHVGKGATDFVAELCTRFQDVIYILGNHEFYHNDMNEIRRYWRDTAKLYCNLHVLDNGVLEYHDIRILGTTLWTSTNDPVVGLYMNDYAIIYNDGEVLTPHDTRELYLQNLMFLQEELAKPFTGQTIVVTHHAPTELCVGEKFQGHFLNKCFHNNLDWLLDEYKIDMWIHGHMHDAVHLMYGGTEIFANPRGYAGLDSNPRFTHDMIIVV